MANNKINIRLINATSWKLKVLNIVVQFLNWATIPKSVRGKQDVVINVKFEI